MTAVAVALLHPIVTNAVPTHPHLSAEEAKLNPTLTRAARAARA